MTSRRSRLFFELIRAVYLEARFMQRCTAKAEAGPC